MFTNTAFSPQPLPSCHLGLHSDICLNPPSQLKPIRHVYKHSFFSLTTSLLSSCVPQWYMLKSSQPTETYPYKHSFFSPTTSLLSSCLPQWYKFQNPLSQLKPIRHVYKHRFFSPTTSLLSSCLPQWYMLKSSQPTETYPYKHSFFSPTTSLLSSCFPQWYKFQNPLSQLKPIRHFYKHRFFSPTTSLLSSCLPQLYMLKSSQPNWNLSAMFTNLAFLLNPIPSLLSSCLAQWYIRILSAQVYKHRFFSASTSLLSSCLAQWYMFNSLSPSLQKIFF